MNNCQTPQQAACGNMLLEVFENKEVLRFYFSDVGERGLSAYELAVTNGFSGTLDEWLESLVGPPVPVAQELGDDPDLAVSQKLLKDSIDSMEFNSSEAVSEAERLNSLSRQAANSAAEASSAAAESASKAASSESIASDKAEFASQSADSASNSLAYVLEKADEAELNAERAEGAAARTETAKDAAFVNADVYPDVATGLAAVADGEQFQVVDGDEITRYRRDSSSTYTLVARYPSARAIQELSVFYGDGEFSNIGFIMQSGKFLTSDSFRATDFLEVLGGQYYTISADISGNARHAWYDKDKVFISSFEGEVRDEITVKAPYTARYLRASTHISFVGRAYVAGLGVNIRGVIEVMGQHPTETVASKVAYRQETAQSALDRLIAQQQQMVVTQNGLLGEIDLISDESQPFFVPTWEYTKAPYGGSESIGDIVTRNDSSTMTLAAGQGAIFTDARQSLVVRDDETGRYHRYGVKTIQGDVIAVNGILPVTISQCAPMHDANLGQHLSRFGYKGLADFLVDRLQKYAYKKPDNLIFAYHPPVCSSPAYNDSNIWNFDNSEMLVEVTRLPGTVTGGFIPGTGDKLAGGCTQGTKDAGLADDPQSVYLSRYYNITQGAAGTGMYFSFDAQQAVGFIEIPFSVARRAYRDGSGFTSGRGRLEVLGDGTEVLFDKTYQAGAGLNIEYVDFAGFDQITIRVTCVDNLPSNIRLGGVYAYRKSDKTPVEPFFNDGDVVAFLGDSWTQFPLAAPGEDRPLRPDGTTPEGLQFFPERVRERLAEDGVNITTLNLGKGGQTSEWGRYWVNKVTDLIPKPTHCVINFGINDSNSIRYYEGNQDSNYDFDPVDMWLNKTQSAGGLRGSTSTERWFENMQFICRRLSSSGIKPIVMMPAHVSSDAQALSLRNRQLNRIAAGFSDINDARD